MFCPKCGADAQKAESYCTRCGEWLPDVNSFTRTLQKKIEQSRLKAETLPHKTVEQLGAGESTTLVNQQSVVENTTKHLDAVPRKVKQ